MSRMASSTRRFYSCFAVFEPCDDGSFSAYFPDLPGTATAGDSEAETVERAKECLALHLRRILEDGAPIPEPSATADAFELEVGDLVRKIDVDLAERFPERAKGRDGVQANAGRPSQTPQGKATQKLVIRVTPEENERLAELARRAGTTKSDVRALVAAQK